MMIDISIPAILAAIGDEYVLLKRPDGFPAFLEGSDIDILVLDKSIASKSIQSYLVGILDGKTDFLRVSESPEHIHIDIIRRGKLLVRVDLIDGFDFFTQFSIQDSLKTKIFLTRLSIQVDSHRIFIPSNEFDLLIRYLEYLEWFDRRPDKIKHVDHILANSTKEEQAQLADDIHRFVRLHHSNWAGKVPAHRSVVKPVLSKIVTLIKRTLPFITSGII